MTLRLRRRAAFLAAGWLLLALATPGFAQAPPPDSTPYGQRTDAFRRLLHEFQYQPVRSFAELQTSPGESVLVVLGDPRCLARSSFGKGLRSFVEQGGGVLIATDKRIEGDARPVLIDLAGVTVTGETLVCSARDLIYREEMYCPFVQPIEASQDAAPSANVLGTLAAMIGAAGRPPLFRNPRPGEPALRVVTNAPSRLQIPEEGNLPRGIHRLAHLPAACIDETLARLSILDFGTKRDAPLFAVGGTRGSGRVLVLADHSIFINRMILPRDTGNLEFTANCLHWLRGGAMSSAEALRALHGQGDSERLLGKPKKALFMDDNQLRTDFHVPMKEAPTRPSLPSTPALVAAFDQAFTRSADQYLARAQETNALNRGLLEALDDHGWTWSSLTRAALYVLTFGLFALLVYRHVWAGRYQPEAGVPALERAVAEHEPKASLLEQRRRTLLRAGNVWETAHQLARQCFESAGIPVVTAVAPLVVVQGSWWHRWRVSRRVARLWELAQGTAPARIPPAALRRWLRELDELKSALARGTIKLPKDEG